MRIICDTREPWPHPWQRYLPPGWTLERGTMETGDFCISALPLGVVIERKTAADLAACIGRERERFERELKRSRYCGRFIVICEGNLSDVARAARGVSCNSIAGSLAAWSVRYAPFVFCGSVQAAAEFCYRSLASQIRDARRTADAIEHHEREATVL